jgi:hypothetical protein
MYRTSGGRIGYPIERLFIDRNRSYFTRKSFVALLKSLGFDVLRVKKTEYPISKITTNWWEACALRALYALAWLTHRQAQIIVLATKR